MGVVGEAVLLISQVRTHGGGTAVCALTVLVHGHQIGTCWDGSGERVLGWGKRQHTPALKCTSLGCAGEALCSQSKSRTGVVCLFSGVSLHIVPPDDTEPDCFRQTVGRKTRSKPGGTPEQNYGGPIRN
jgi:hypothetical protein